MDSLSDRQIDALLSGSAGLDEDLEGIADILSAVKGFAVPDPEADFSHLFLGAVEESRLTPIELFARERLPRAYDWQTRMTPRVALAVAALLVLVTVSGGMAHAANGAKPGDLLYSLDRAMEAIGIGDGGSDERLAEAHALAASDVEPSGLFQASEMSNSPPTTDPTPEASVPSADHLEVPPSEPSVEPPGGSLIDEPDDGTGSLDDEKEPEWTGSTGGVRDNEPDPGETDRSTASGDEGSDDSTDDTDDTDDQNDDTDDTDDQGDDSDDTDDQNDDTDDQNDDTDDIDDQNDDTDDTTENTDDTDERPENGSADDDDADDDADYEPNRP